MTAYLLSNSLTSQLSHSVEIVFELVHTFWCLIIYEMLQWFVFIVDSHHISTTKGQKHKLLINMEKVFNLDKFLLHK